MPLALPGRLVLFDYGNVITRPQSDADRAALLELADVPGDRFWPAYWADRNALDHGRLSVRDYWLGIGLACGVRWAAGRLQELWAADLRSWTTADPDVVAVLDELHEGGTRLAVLSNAGLDYALLRFSPLAALVERVFLSAELGLLKPDPAIYLRVAEDLGIPADRIVFVDDRAGNVAGAESVGMTGHVFTGAAGLRAFLLELARTSRETTHE
jgi:putative hydrolase of the HAD superfamily